MLFNDFKKVIALILSLAVFSVTSYAKNLDADGIVKYKKQAGAIRQALNYYNFQMDSKIVTPGMAKETLTNNIKALLDKGVDPYLLQNEIISTLPTDIQDAFYTELNALNIQNASVEDISKLIYDIAKENPQTGAAFSSFAGDMGHSKVGIVIGIIAIVLIAVAIDKIDDNDHHDHDDDDDDDDDDCDYHHCDHHGHGGHHGGGHGHGGNHGCGYYGHGNC